VNIRLWLPRDLTLAAINGLARYHELMEAQLLLASHQELEHLTRKIKGMHLTEDEERREWGLARQEHEMDFGMLMPNYYRYSCVVLVYLVVESRLQEVCDVARRLDPSLPEFKRPRSDVLGRYCKYLICNVRLRSQYWDAIHDLSLVRNCIVHACGDVRYSDQRADLQRIANTDIGLSIGWPSAELNLDLLPLYLGDDTLMMESRYCKHIISVTRSFFEELYHGLGGARPVPQLTAP